MLHLEQEFDDNYGWTIVSSIVLPNVRRSGRFRCFFDLFDMVTLQGDTVVVGA